MWGLEFTEVLLVGDLPAGIHLSEKEPSDIVGILPNLTDPGNFCPKINIVSCCPWNTVWGSVGLGEGHIEGLA